MAPEHEFLLIWAWTPRLFEEAKSEEISWGGMNRPSRMQAVALILAEATRVCTAAQHILLAAIATGLSSPKTGTPSCFTEDKFRQITQRFGDTVVESLIRHKRGDFKITEWMMIDIARSCGPAVVDFALQEKAENIPLSEDLLLAALYNHSDEVFHLLLASTWTTIKITDCHKTNI